MSTATCAPAFDGEPDPDAFRVGDRVEWVGDPARVGIITWIVPGNTRYGEHFVEWASGPVIDDWGWYGPNELRHEIPEHPFDPIPF
jgi:hypothetical protein